MGSGKWSVRKQHRRFLHRTRNAPDIGKSRERRALNQSVIHNLMPVAFLMMGSVKQPEV